MVQFGDAVVLACRHEGSVMVSAESDLDYDTEATESELALSEPGASPSPPVHQEFTEHRAAAPGH